MGISQYIKEIGRGKDGARSLTREQATDLLGQVLDGAVTDLEVGGFCLAMRIKGETAEEMAGFLDATHARLHKLPDNGLTTVVLPSYNGARKLPVLTPLLALLLAQRGAAVLVHGTATEDKRVFASSVFAELGVQAAHEVPAALHAGSVAFIPTQVLNPGLKRLLDVRRAVGLRNPAHSLVKLMNPCAGKGEPVADARRTPRMEVFRDGARTEVQAQQDGPLAKLPFLPAVDAASTAAYIRAVLDGTQPIPHPIALQMEHILQATVHHEHPNPHALVV